MSHPRSRVALWVAAALVVPALLAGVALVWPGPPQAAPAGPVTAGVTPPGAGEPAPDPAAEVARLLAAAPITFPADDATLRGAPAGTVAAVAAVLVPARDVPVRVEGHVADTPGGPDVAQRLSDERARAVADALVAAGVRPDRLTVVGLAATEPLATPEASRRVEIEIEP
jgi:outer membrane protein OmpA-like peptidoglycan-associated protein